MNKADLTEALAARANIPKVRAANYINIVMGTIQDALVTGEKVTISDFGTFTVSERREFVGHNPKNGAEIRVPARKIPVFRAARVSRSPSTLSPPLGRESGGDDPCRFFLRF